MKYTLLQVFVLTAVVALAVGLGRGLVTERWGPSGVAALYAAAVICLIGGVLAAIPLGVVATYWPQHAPMTAFGATAIRLLVTGALAIGYEVFAAPALTPFLACILAIYLLLLVAETALIVTIVRRVYAPHPPHAE